MKASRSVSWRHREAVPGVPMVVPHVGSWTCRHEGHGKQLRFGTVRGLWWRWGLTSSWRPRLKRSCKVEFWHHEDSLWEAIGESAAQLQQGTPVFGRASTKERPVRTAAAVWGQQEPRRQAVCAAKGRAREVTQDLWRNLEDREWIPDNWTLN